MQFNSTNSWVNLGDMTSYPASYSFTMATWVKSSQTGGDPSIFGNKDWNSGSNPGFFGNWIISNGTHIVGSCAFSDDTYAESVAHLAAGRVPVERLVSERVSLDDTPDALRRLQAPGSLVRIISRPSA